MKDLMTAKKRDELRVTGKKKKKGKKEKRKKGKKRREKREEKGKRDKKEGKSPHFVSLFNKCRTL